MRRPDWLNSTRTLIGVAATLLLTMSAYVQPLRAQVAEDAFTAQLRSWVHAHTDDAHALLE